MIAAPFTMVKTWKQLKCLLTDEWIKMWYMYTCIHTHNGILLSHKKNEIMPFAAIWMGLEFITLSKVSQKEKDKYNISLTSGI